MFRYLSVGDCNIREVSAGLSPPYFESAITLLRIGTARILCSTAWHVLLLIQGRMGVKQVLLN